MLIIPSYEAGRAFVQVTPSFRGVQAKISAEFDKVRGVEVDVTAKADTSQVHSALAKATRNPPVARIKAEVDKASIARAEAAIAAAAGRLAKARDAEADATGKVRVAELALQKVREKSGSDVSRLAAAEERLESAKRRSAAAGRDAVAVEQQLNAARDNLRDVKVRVEADTGKATADLATVSAQARRVDAQRVNVAVNANDVSRAITLVGLLTTALAGVSATGAPALAVLGAIPVLGGVAAQGIAGVATGFSGVSDAVKALQKAETEAAVGTGAAAKARVAATDRITSAQRSLRQAQTQADRAAITGAQQVQDAVARVRAADDNLTRAKTRQLDVQRALNRAREDATEQLQQLEFSVEGADIAQQRAALRLIEARKALEEAQANAARPMGDPDREVIGDLGWENLKLDVREAELAVKETEDRFSDLKKESAQAARTGIDGTEGVISAQRAAADATQGVRDAEQDLTDARTDAARAHQQAAWAQADATEQVAEAQRQLGQAIRDTGTAGTAAMDGVAEAMLHLSPAGQQFARFFSEEVLPGLRAIRGEVQASLLPQVETSLRNLKMLGPEVSAGLSGTGEVLGDLTVRGSEMMTTGPWRRDFATILAANNRILDDFGTAGLESADVMRSVTIAGLPMVERFSQATQRGAEMVNQWIQTKRATGELDEFFDQAGDTLAELGDIALQVVTGVVKLTNELGPLGMVVLHTVGAVAELVGNFAEAYPTITQVIATGLIAVTMFNFIGKAVAGASLAVGVATGGWRTLIGVMGALAPSAVAQTAVMQGLSRGLDTAAASAGAMTTAVIRKAAIVENSAEVDRRAAAAGERVAAVGGTVSRAVTAVGAALPVAAIAAGALAIAYDTLVVSANEAADAINRGGVEAEKARDEIDVLERGTAGWLSFLRPLITTQEEATQAAKEQRDALGPLARAELDAKQAAADHQLILRDYSPVSEQGRAASQRLADAQDELERQQRGASEATKDHTDRILEQQGVMQGALSSDLAYREALESVNEQLRELAGASTISSEESLRLEGSIIRAAEAAKRRALDNYADKTSVEAVTASNQAYNQAILDLITTAGTNAPAALLAYIGRLSEAELKAIGARIETDNLGSSVAILPDGKEIVITTTASTAEGQVKSLHQALDNLPKTTHADIYLRPLVQGAHGQFATPPPSDFPGLIPPYATGGPIQGPGTATSDSILIRGSDGEHMWSVAEVQGAGGHAALERMRAMARAGTLPGFAGGGPIGRTSGGMVRAEDGSLVPLSFYSRTAGPHGAPYTGSLPDPIAAAKAFGQLSDILTDQLRPALEKAQIAARIDTADAIKALAVVTQERAATMGRDWQGLGRGVLDATTGMARSITELQLRHNASWTDIRAHAATEVGNVTGPIFGGLHAGIDGVVGGAAVAADQMRIILDRVRAYFADPLRWALQVPINVGLKGAWGEIDRFFALGRPWGGVPVGFAEGGRITGGIPGKDSVPIMAMEDEFVVRREIARPARRFLEALNAGQPEAMQAAGGRFARFAEGGAIERGQAFARAQHGKPYIWGGVGPAGYDCSGFMSALTNVLLGQQPHRRRFTTASFARGPAGGLVPGLNSAFGIGVFQGNPGHTAGTLAGLNVESGGSPSRTKAGAGAAGATHPQFRQHFSLPQVGGRFIDGGSGGGIDVAAYLDKQFVATRRMIGQITEMFGSGNPPTLMVRLATDAVAGAAKSATVYDGGGWLPPGYSTVYNGTGTKEALAVFNRQQWRDVSAAGQGGTQKHYHLTVVDANNGRIDLETQFRRLEMRSGV